MKCRVYFYKISKFQGDVPPIFKGSNASGVFTCFTYYPHFGIVSVYMFYVVLISPTLVYVCVGIELQWV